jgi:hypothetical protein
MKYLRTYEHYLENIEDFNSRHDYVLEVINFIKDILLPFVDNEILITCPGVTRIGMISNILYSKKYLNTYNNFYKQVFNQDLSKLSDLFFIYMEPNRWNDFWEAVENEWTKKTEYQVSSWALDCLYDLERYMTSEGFKIDISLTNHLYNKDVYKFDSVKCLEKVKSCEKIKTIKIGFNI